MKFMLGSDVGSFVFDPASKTITFSGVDLQLKNVLLITNVKTGDILYNFASKSQQCSISGNVITLTFDTTLMNAADELQIYVDIPSTYLGELSVYLRKLLHGVLFPSFVDRSLNSARISIVSGSVGIATSQTLATLTDQTNIGGYQAKGQVLNNNLNSWSNTVRRRFT